MPDYRTAGARVCAVVLNWNRPYDTQECLESLLPMIRQRRLALVVCDNASEDDSIDRIRNWADRHFQLVTASPDSSSSAGLTPPVDWDFLLVQTGANRGYAGGNNVGIRHALAREKTDFVWILNNDTTVDRRALDALMECAERDSRVGVLGSTITNYHRPNLVQMAGGCRYQPLTSVMRGVYGGRNLADVLDADPDERLDYVSGAAMFCRAEMFRKIGLFDERFFLYYEEIDLARRMRAAGYSIAWCKHSIVYHKGGVSTGGRSSANREESWQSAYHENLSTLLYTQKHHFPLLPLVGVLRLLGKSFAYLLGGRMRLLPALMAAYRDAVRGKSASPIGPVREPTVLDIGSSADIS